MTSCDRLIVHLHNPNHTKEGRIFHIIWSPWLHWIAQGCTWTISLRANNINSDYTVCTSYDTQAQLGTTGTKTTVLCFWIVATTLSECQASIQTLDGRQESRPLEWIKIRLEWIAWEGGDLLHPPLKWGSTLEKSHQTVLPLCPHLFRSDSIIEQTTNQTCRINLRRLCWDSRLKDRGHLFILVNFQKHH